MRPTVKVTRSPTVMLIGAPPALAAQCDTELPLPALRVAHVAAATQRIPVTRPLIVIAFGALPPGDDEMLRDACAGTGSMLLEAAKDASFRELKTRVIEALVVIERRGP